MKFLKVGRTDFNIEAVKQMSEKQFLDTYKNTRFPNGVELKDLYKRITGQKAEK